MMVGILIMILVTIIVKEEVGKWRLIKMDYKILLLSAALALGITACKPQEPKGNQPYSLNISPSGYQPWGVLDCNGDGIADLVRIPGDLREIAYKGYLAEGADINECPGAQILNVEPMPLEMGARATEILKLAQGIEKKLRAD